MVYAQTQISPVTSSSSYFSGHETTAIKASRSLMLLAAHPEWQAYGRVEVPEICGDSLPDANML